MTIAGWGCAFLFAIISCDSIFSMAFDLSHSVTCGRGGIDAENMDFCRLLKLPIPDFTSSSGLSPLTERKRKPIDDGKESAHFKKSDTVPFKKSPVATAWSLIQEFCEKKETMEKINQWKACPCCTFKVETKSIQNIITHIISQHPEYVGRALILHGIEWDKLNEQVGHMITTYGLTCPFSGAIFKKMHALKMHLLHWHSLHEIELISLALSVKNTVPPLIDLKLLRMQQCETVYNLLCIAIMPSRCVSTRGHKAYCPCCSTSFEGPAKIIGHVASFHADYISSAIKEAKREWEGIDEDIKRLVNSKNKYCSSCSIEYTQPKAFKVHLFKSHPTADLQKCIRRLES